MVGACGFRPTRRHRPRRRGEIFKGPESLLKKWPGVLEPVKD